MDILLEFADTFIADYVYAHLFPITHSNETEFNASTPLMEPWVWRPASKLLNVQPSQAAYMSSLTRDNPYRQFFTLMLSAWIFGTINYFTFTTLSYHLLFDKRYKKHPKFLKNQIWKEIKMSNELLLAIAILTTPLFLLGFRGYIKLYDTTADGPGWWYDILQVPLYVLYIDFCTYWLHRFAHHPRIYNHKLFMHKFHHRFVITTPYSCNATHPIEGFLNVLPHFIFPFVLPLQKMVHFGMFVTVNLWHIVIHDGKFLTNNRIVNSAACHSLHHIHSNCNYAAFFALFDRLHGTYREPDSWMFQEKRWTFELPPEKGSLIENELFKQNSGKDQRQKSE